ncbi:dihydroneopterin triphosphate diphosphatase [soil metagenome]
MPNVSFKIPRSVLVVIYTEREEVLLLERADKIGFWQSVTGSLDSLDETPLAAAQRELFEETGIDAVPTDWHHQIDYEIYPHWRHRYAPGVTTNTEHWFGLRLADRVPVTIAAREHVTYAWLPRRAAAERCFSSSNRQAIESLRFAR